jgi:hypothetical protein
LQSAALLAIFVCGIGISIHSVTVALRDMYVFPYWDMVGQQFEFFQSWSKFFLHRGNEHIMLAVMPFYFADNIFFSSRGIFLIALILAFNGLIAGLLIEQLKSCWGRNELALAAAGGLIVAILFWLIHWENLLWPEQLHMYVAAVLILLAGRYAARLDMRLRLSETLNLPAATIIGLILAAATFSFGYGVVGWIAVFILALTGRWPRGTIAPLIAIFLTTTVFYAALYNYATTKYASNPITSLADPISVMRYVGYYLANPIIALFTPIWRNSDDFVILSRGYAAFAVATGLVITVGGVALAVAIMWRTLITRRKQATPTDLFIVYLIIFSVGTAFITALSRLRLGSEQALSSRYTMIQVLFWLGLGLAAAKAAQHRTMLRASLLACVGVLVMASIVDLQMRGAILAKTRLQTHWLAVLALVNGVDDMAQIASIHPNFDTIRNVAGNLSDRRWSVYADPQPHWLNQSAAGLFQEVPAARCRGAFDEVSDLQRLRGQSYVRGWAWDMEQERPSQWVVLIDRKGDVRGLARSGWDRPDVAAAYPMIPQMVGATPGWRGYVAAPLPLPDIDAYAVLSDNASICRLPRNPASLIAQTSP